MLNQSSGLRETPQVSDKKNISERMWHQRKLFRLSPDKVATNERVQLVGARTGWRRLDFTSKIKFRSVVKTIFQGSSVKQMWKLRSRTSQIPKGRKSGRINEVTGMSKCIRSINRSHFDVGTAGSSRRMDKFICTSENVFNFFLGSEETDSKNPAVASESKLLRDPGSGTCTCVAALASWSVIFPIILITAGAEAGDSEKARGDRRKAGVGRNVERTQCWGRRHEEETSSRNPDPSKPAASFVCGWASPRRVGAAPAPTKAAAQWRQQ